MTHLVSTAVLPVAGLGTRFLPVTKASPKEMLPIVDKPLIQYVVEEAVRAGIKELIFVTCSTKRTIEDYFDSNIALEYHLETHAKLEALKTVKEILPPDVNCIYVRQPYPLGLGDAVLRAKPAVADRPFALLLADDIVDDPSGSCIGRLMDVFQQVDASVVGVEEVDPQLVHKYGILAVEKNAQGMRVTDMVEKPSPDEAPSHLAAAGRYVFKPAIFDYLEKTERGAGNEIQLTDAIAAMLHDQAVYAKRFDGKRFDCGSQLGYLKAMVHYALQRADIGEDFADYLKHIARAAHATA